MIQKTAPHSLIVPLILALSHYTHLGNAAIDEHIFNRLPALTGGMIQTLAHYALPVLLWFALWALVPVIAKILILLGKLMHNSHSLISELGNLVATWVEGKALTGLYMIASRARTWLVEQIRQRRDT